MDTAAATPYNADELCQLYNCSGQPEKHRFTLANFETRPCSRCGGGGHYSYCTAYGTRCFGCGGRGYQLTGRGQAALDFYRELQARPLATLLPRLAAADDGVPVLDRDGKRCTLVACDGGTYVLRYANITSHHTVQDDTLVRVRWATPEQRDAALAAAQRYAASLTKTGKPRVRRAAKAAA